MKTRNILGLLGNIAVFLISALLIGGLLINGQPFEPIDLLLDYQLVAICVLGIVSFVGIILNIVSLARKKDIRSNFYYAIRVISFNVMLIAVLLIPVQSSPKWFELNLVTFTSLVLFVYILVSILALDSFFRTKIWAALVASIVPGLYFASIYILYAVNVLKELPYSFMYLVIDSKAEIINIAAFILFVLLPFMTSICLWLYTRRHKNVEEIQVVEASSPEEKKVDSSKKTTKKEEKAPTTKKTASTKTTKGKEVKKTSTKKVSDKKETKKPTKKAKVSVPPSVDIEIPENIDYEYRIYHVTKRSDVDYYQVKYGKDVRCIKLFKTMDEASKYAHTLASVTGASVRIHGEDGRISKVKK